MLSDSTKLLELKQSQKSDKAPFINYADLECIIEKIDACKNNPEKLSATKVSENTPSIFLNVYHCHYTWQYRGAAHSKCNLKHLKKFI